MARRYDSLLTGRSDGDTAVRRVDHSTARAFAAALSALAISTLVVTTSSSALQPRGTIAANHFQAGTVSVTDDDEGHSLVNLTNMSPARPVEKCIRVIYEGSIVPVSLTLAATTAGDLAPYLTVSVERGTGAGFDSCDGFVANDVVFDGRLSDMDDLGMMSLGRLLNTGDSVSFRFVFELADDEAAVGRAGSADFSWQVSPE